MANAVVHNGRGTAEKLKILKNPALKINLYFGRILLILSCFLPGRRADPVQLVPVQLVKINQFYFMIPDAGVVDQLARIADRGQLTDSTVYNSINTIQGPAGARRRF